MATRKKTPTPKKIKAKSKQPSRKATSPVGRRFSYQQKQKKIRALRAMIRSRKRKRYFGLYGQVYSRPSSNLIIDYFENNGALPKLDKFNSLQQGALVKTLDKIDGRSVRPKNREGIRSYYYLLRILVELPVDTQMMFLERHPTLPEWYKFFIIGGRVVWVDVSDYIDQITIMKKSSKSKSGK